MTERELALRRTIMEAFAATGEPPVVADTATLHALAAQHVVVLEPGGTRIRMAHPFAAHRDGTRVQSGDRVWFGNCAWDGLGIAAALGLGEARIASGDVTLELRGGELVDDTAVFHVAVPAAHWWDDIAHT